MTRYDSTDGSGGSSPCIPASYLFLPVRSVLTQMFGASVFNHPRLSKMVAVSIFIHLVVLMPFFTRSGAHIVKPLGADYCIVAGAVIYSWL
jgi:hypothetical protein